MRKVRIKRPGEGKLGVLEDVKTGESILCPVMGMREDKYPWVKCSEECAWFSTGLYSNYPTVYACYCKDTLIGELEAGLK